MLYLKPNATPDMVLGEMAARPDIKLHSYELAVPSLSEIFVEVVQQRPNGRGNGNA
ncbi:MAG: hypothetical protein IPK19_37165 [Chloroflexi bacterium]|nr:hypothetical protein [Chloroflexota bacterium]